MAEDIELLKAEITLAMEDIGTVLPPAIAERVLQRILMAMERMVEIRRETLVEMKRAA